MNQIAELTEQNILTGQLIETLQFFLPKSS